MTIIINFIAFTEQQNLVPSKTRKQKTTASKKHKTNINNKIFYVIIFMLFEIMLFVRRFLNELKEHLALDRQKFINVCKRGEKKNGGDKFR